MTRPPAGVVLLGATGSIGTQALDVIGRHPDRFRLLGCVSGTRQPAVSAPHVLTADDPDFDARVDDLVAHPECDIVLVAIPGARALRPTLTALHAHKHVAIASKEVLVMAGDLVTAIRGRDALRPVDSEHSAIWQCLWGEHPGSVERLLLTATGGPFRDRPEVDFATVTVEQALAHPRWNMGPKVSIDSATLMNKALEVIEAHHLFGIPIERVDVVVHPQAVVHSMVEFVDGSVKAQLGNPDMRLPIALALAFPERLPGAVPPPVLTDVGRLDFEALDGGRFPAPALAREAVRLGGGRPAVLNAANEEAVAAFLERRLPFGEIVPLVQDALDAFAGAAPDLPGVLAADAWARSFAQGRMGGAVPRS